MRPQVPVWKLLASQHKPCVNVKRRYGNWVPVTVRATRDGWISRLRGKLWVCDEVTEEGAS